ncbi:hypothetical protein GCM10011519_25840 [Marmoricola endophyticus]|uniref:Cytidylate kinase-like family protein n=1 Tax=Marmoricola endophyticus TaxID=2040280 RepID=A0A917BNE7_9ACTN|nr:cytidylate kinase-like family protein [Marmoricola endophyticus]GGF50709.1 hypothetical protein GCM10011519_25840 [Marmoricola endophyticus]
MIVTISASYAAGGSELGPQVAQRLDLPFVDRAIPVAVADELGVSVEEATAVAEDTGSRLWDAFAWMSPLGGLPPTLADGHGTGERELIAATEAQLRRTADETGAVILGHAGAVVLADRPDALHVRLDGAPEGRIAAAVRQHGISAEDAAAQLRTNDKLRSGYVKHFYRADSADPAFYDLVIDTVRVDWARAVDLMVLAATK